MNRIIRAPSFPCPWPTCSPRNQNLVPGALVIFLWPGVEGLVLGGGGNSTHSPNPAPQQLHAPLAPGSVVRLSSLGQHGVTLPIGHPPVVWSMEWPETTLFKS